MPGFMSSNTAMTICPTEARKPLNIDNLRKGAFNDAIDPEGKRYGWVGLNDMLDTEDFSLAGEDPRFSGFSYRLDSRKPASAVVRLQLAEKIRAEQEKGIKIGGKRKKELREEIVDRLTAQAEFVPALTDCLWDSQTGMLYIASTSEKVVERILNHFKGCFSIEAAPLAPEKDMAELFSRIQQGAPLKAFGHILEPMGSASLLSEPASEEKSAIAVRNSLEAVSEALKQGLAINRISLVAASQDNEERQIFFSVDTSLGISGLRFPKAEKGAGQEAVFLVNADICATVGGIVSEMAASGDE